MLKVDYITNSIFNSITYILSEDNSDNVWVVDCGDIDPLVRIIGERHVEGILLTHTHFDHIYGIPEFLKFYPNVPIFTNEWGKVALANDKWNLSRYHETPIVIESDNIKTVREGDVVCNFNIIETPGHSPSCLCYLGTDAIFTGDAYIPGIPVVTNLPKCNKTQAEDSRRRIQSIAKGKVIFPGHKI